MDVLCCDGCRRAIVTENGSAMMDAIKGPCPCCGGCFGLARSSLAPGATAVNPGRQAMAADPEDPGSL